MRNFVSKTAGGIKPSGIRKFFDLVSGSGDPDIISLGVGEPDFKTPWNVREAGVTAIQRGRTQYTSNKGLTPLRKNISEYLKTRYDLSYGEDDVIITIGASEAIDATLRAVIDEGDEVLIPDPSYVSYSPCVELCKGKPIPVPCGIENDFKLTAKALEDAITERSKVLILPYPNNPTGAVMEREFLEKIVPVIIKHDLLVVSDEIYSELTYGEKHVSIASLPEMKERTVYINGFSKAFAMTGWRIGFVCAPKEIASAILKIHQYTIICAPTFSQYAALTAIEDGLVGGFSDIEDMREEYDARRKFMYKTFNDMGLKCFEPKGAFYVFPSVKSLGMTGDEFATALLKEEKVAVVPGSAFGESGKYFIRCSYAYSMKNLAEATTRIARFVSKIKNKGI